MLMQRWCWVARFDNVDNNLDNVDNVDHIENVGDDSNDTIVKSLSNLYLIFVKPQKHD